MRLGAWILCVTVFLCGSFASAGTFVPLNSNAAPVEVRSSEPANGAVRLEFDLGGFESSPVAIDGRTYQAIGLGEEAHSLDAGLPELPVVARSVIIPDDAEMSLRIVEADYVDFENYDVVPSKGNLLRNVDPESVPYTFAAAYGQDAFYPSTLAGLSDPYILRDLRGATVRIQPFQVNPVRHVLRVYRHVVVEATPSGPGRVNVLNHATPEGLVSREFSDLYAAQFVNFDPSRYAPIPEVGEMIVIAYDDFAAAMQPLVDWKNQEGIPTALFTRSQVGTTYQAFQTFIQNYYNSHDLAFVLLVGDNAQIPSPSSAGAPADPVYALVSGGDNYPDIFIGRLSAESVDQVNVQVLKSVEYESAPQAGAAWYRRGIGIGSGQGAGIGDDGEADYQHMGVIRTKLLGFTYTGVDTIYEVSGYPSSAQAVANAVNDGRSVINYCGHGSNTSWGTTGFSNTHVAQLINYNKLPWILSVACVNGAYHQGTCFAEAWTRAFRDGEPTGAVGMYASTVNMGWAPPMAAQDESVDLLVANAKRTIGALLYSGSCLMMDQYGGSGVSEFKNWHIFGDPSLRVRSATPTSLTVVHDEMIEPDATTFTVTVPGVSGALCGLSKNGEFLGSAFTGSDGVAVISVVGALPADSITLTVGYFNKLPYVTEVEVGIPLIPTLEVSPSEFVVTLADGGTQVENLSITNSGMEGSILTYKVSVSPGQLYPWITLGASDGTCGAGETDLVQVTFNADVVLPGEYHARIVVTAERLDPVSVPVTMFAGTMSAVDGRDLPARLTLEPARPNPFAGATALTFGLPTASRVELGVFDAGGRLVRVLLRETLPGGWYHQAWDGRDDGGRSLPAGVYLYKLNAQDRQLTQKVMLLR